MSEEIAGLWSEAFSEVPQKEEKVVKPPVKLAYVSGTKLVLRYLSPGIYDVKVTATTSKGGNTGQAGKKVEAKLRFKHSDRNEAKILDISKIKKVCEQENVRCYLDVWRDGSIQTQYRVPLNFAQ